MTNLTYDDVQTKTLGSSTRKRMADQIKQDIDAFCVKELTQDHRSHLGASLVGLECARRIWYSFRWAKGEIFDGRMLRLFERGHLEEQRIIRWLRGIGFTVWDVDPQTNQQFRIWGVGGHYGGSSDSVGIPPYFPDLPMLLEFKTHNTKSFSNLINKGVQLAKPQHYSQMCAYGKHYSFRYGLYVAVNKNDDDIYIEVVELNWELAHDLENKAADIIQAKVPPARISEQPSYFECKMCPFQGICFYEEPVEKNCRSCKLAHAADNKEWYCNRYHNNIPQDFIATGCDGHTSINT